MSSTEMAMRRPDHPWLDAFEAAPEATFDALIRGVALPHPYGRAEPVDVLDTMLGMLDEADPLRRLLDRVVAQWIAARRAEPPRRRLEYGMERYVRELGDAFQAVYRLSLPDTARRLGEENYDYRTWLDGLVLAPSRDPRAEFLRALAQRQESVGFEPLWYELCEGAGRRFPENYLRIGLLGLRRLPDRARDASDEVLAGFARWAMHLGEGERFRFQRQWRMLKTLYPRGPGYWARHVPPLFKGRAERPFVDWWRAEVPEIGKADQGRSRPAASRLPTRKELEAVLGRLGNEPVSAVRADVEHLITGYVDHAERTGDGHFAVRTACNIGDMVLVDAPDLAHDLARIAVRWEPGNPFGWTLWARSLAAGGHEDLAEIVFWETLRRFPDNDVSRNALAELLARTGREGDAEALYRQTMSRFPNNDVSRNALAELLARTGREGDAEALFRQTMGAFPDNVVCRTALAVLLIRRGGDADAVIAEVRPLDPASARTLSAAVERRRKGQEPFPDHAESPAVRSATVDDAEARALGDDGRVLRADFRLGPALDTLPEETRADLRAQAVADLDAVLAARPNHAGAILVAMERLPDDRAERWAGLEPAFPHNYGLRLAFARARRDAAATDAILATFPERAPLTRLAAGLRGTDDAGHVADWLAGEPPADDPVLAFVHGRMCGWKADDILALAARKDPDLEAAIATATRMAVNEQNPILRA